MSNDDYEVGYGKTDLVAAARLPAVTHPWAADLDRPDPRLDLALRQIPVAHDPTATRRNRQIGVPLDESRHLHLNRLRQKTPRAKAQNLRQWIL